MAWEWEERTEQSLNLTNSTIFSNSSILNYDYDNTLDNSNPSQNATASSEADQVYAISNAVSIVFIIIVVLVIFFWRRYQRNKKKLKKLTKEEVSKFLEGDSALGDPSIDPDSNLPFSIPYDRNFEIDLNDVDIDTNQLLGSGAYGLVYKGKLKVQSQLPVAIKMLKPNADIIYFRSLLSELKVMTFIGEHENIVKCIGASTAELTSRKLYIIVEFCALGSMEQYLRTRRDDFKHLNKGKPASESEYQNCIPIINPEPTLNVQPHEKRISYSKYVNLARTGESGDKLTVVDLIRFGYEISNAMDFLFNKKIIHGDLACRNVLLNEYRKVKVTDFGLSRQMMNYSTYVKTAKQNALPLPWRWLALEAIKNSVFSSKSDVWSFGVTLWEIFSLAQVPYPGLAYSQEFIRMLEKGLRMNPPSDWTSPAIYKIMVDTWHEIPEERPTFAELKEILLELCLDA